MENAKPIWATRILLLLLAVAFGGCASVPLDYPKTPTAALTDTNDTTLARYSNTWRGDYPDGNGFYPLTEGIDAFGARLTMIDKAEKSIDAQYFMMKADSAGLVFCAELLEAADRGVRVRFLLDDIFTTVDDSALILLNEHPNIEMRIFNPIARKGVFVINYLGHFRLANRRMHNKSFTVDNQVAVVGGRNIAEEYFQLDSTGEFIDFDMLVTGPIVKEVSTEFDRYWNHELAIPMNALYDKADPDEMADLRNRIKERMEEERESVYGRAINSNVIHGLAAGEIKPFPAEARMIVDDPQKLLEDISDEQKVVATEIRKELLAATDEILIFTPYFIPGKRGMETIREITANGVRVVILTNSLATNNHTSVHSAYSSYRKRLLEAGVELWEARGDAAEVINEDGTKSFEQLTLHTKGIIIDRKHVFVGSLNLDPRSIDINTEMGIMISSADLGKYAAENSMANMPTMAYQLKLDDNKISWHATIDGQAVTETKEPLTTGWRRFQAWFLKIAPEKQL